MKTGRPLNEVMMELNRQNQRKKDIVLQVKGVQQIEVLKHKAQIVPAELRDILILYR